MEIEERFLPIGTVVLLKGGKRELMITSYCIMPSGDVYDKNGKVDAQGKMFDYGACFYPEGMVTSDQLFAFNHNQIARVCFTGYKTDKQKEISTILNGGLAELEKNNTEKKDCFFWKKREKSTIRNHSLIFQFLKNQI